MSTDAPSPPRVRRRPRAWRGATVPDHLADQLRQAARVSDQIWIIGHATEAEMARKITYLVGGEQARDIARDVTDKMATGAYTPVDGSPLTTPEGYSRLRGYLLTSAHNAARQHRRRLATRSEVLVGEFTDTTVAAAVDRGARTESDDEGPFGALDEAAIHDGLRRLEPLHARILHMKHIDGLKIREINERLGFTSNGLYSRHYNRAIRSLLDVLTTYGRGGFCEGYGPYLLALRQEVDAGDGDERPLTVLVGGQQALEIRFHVYGDPDVASDDGCHACQTATAAQQASLNAVNPLFLLPVAGALGGLKGVLLGAWGHVTGWFGGLFGGAGGALGTGTAAKGIVVAVAATTAVGGGVALERAAHSRRHAPAPAAQTRVVVIPASEPRVGSFPVRRGVASTPVRRTGSRQAARAAAKAPPPVKDRPEYEFAPAPPAPSARVPARSASSSGSSPAGAEFAP